MTEKMDVLICSHNEAESLPALLDSLCVQSTTKEHFRLILVDNGSTDGSKTIIDSYKDRLDILYIQEPRLGKSYALNTGYKLASSEYVAQIDADCKASPDWLENILRVINEEAPDAIGGPYFSYFNSPKPAWYKDEYNQHFRGHERKLLSDGYLDGANTVWRRRIVLDLGGYSEQITIRGADVAGGEDTDLVVRARRSYPELRIIYDPSIVVFHLTKKKYLNVFKMLLRSFKLGLRALHIFQENKSQSGSLRILFSLFGKSLALLISLVRGTFLRNRTKYPYYSNYLLEVVSPSIYTLGFLLAELRSSRARVKKMIEK